MITNNIYAGYKASSDRTGIGAGFFELPFRAAFSSTKVDKEEEMLISLRKLVQAAYAPVASVDPWDS